MLSRWKSKDKSEKSGKAGAGGKKKRKGRDSEEDWHGDGTRMDGLSDSETGRSSSRSRSSRRDDPRRHTLATNNLHVHSHHPSQISLLTDSRSTKQSLNAPEYATVHKFQGETAGIKKQLPIGYPVPNNAHLFEDDPGVMSEVETSSTGFRRGGKQRSSLPVVRTPSKTLERPLVFLQYRTETKRALLPNEITSLDTVKALFVRSFSQQLTMQYLDSPAVKIYMHDASKDVFFELEDVRSHLRDIRDRSVLRLFEANDVVGNSFPGTAGINSLSIPSSSSISSTSIWEEQSYFSEPEIDSEYNHHHVHKSKVSDIIPLHHVSTMRAGLKY
ncbi:unnamed protein product, partial [Iphiclides podalirius]